MSNIPSASLKSFQRVSRVSSTCFAYGKRMHNLLCYMLFAFTEQILMCPKTRHFLNVPLTYQCMRAYEHMAQHTLTYMMTYAIV